MQSTALHSAAETSTAYCDVRIAESLARETDTSLPVAQQIYLEEVSKLAEHARITQFLGVLATRRARLRLQRH